MTQTRSERIARSEAARARRATRKQIIFERTQRLYNRLRKQRKNKVKLRS